MSRTNQNPHTTGNLGEAAVCRYLTAQGYQILDRNFRIRGGEIDIIAARGEELCFVEVKTRRPGAMENGFEAVDERKQERLIRAAYRYCEQHDIGEEDWYFRYDIAEVISLDNRILNIDYLENAFDESDISW